MRRTPKKKLALPLSLLALGALGLVACGGDDDGRHHGGASLCGQHGGDEIPRGDHDRGESLPGHLAGAGETLP